MMMLANPKLFFRALTLTMLTLGLGACGSIVDTGQSMEPDTIFDLAPANLPGGEGTKTSLFMELASYPAYLATKKIVVKPGGHEIRYLAGARWSDTTPALISRHLEVSLEDSGLFTVYSNRQSALPHKYRMFIDIREFSTRFEASGLPYAEMEFEVKLVNARTLDLIAARTFVARTGALENSKAAIAGAFQEGLDGIAAEISGWLTSLGS